MMLWHGPLDLLTWTAINAAERAASAQRAVAGAFRENEAGFVRVVEFAERLERLAGVSIPATDDARAALAKARTELRWLDARCTS